MSDFYQGRVAATFLMGNHLENAKEVYEEEVKQFTAMKTAFAMAGSRLEDYRNKLKEDINSGKVAIKEGECAISYVSACVELVKQLYTDAEARLLTSHGASEAMKKAVADAKLMWDAEKTKLNEIENFEKNQHDLKDRPVGYLPIEHPLSVEKSFEEDSLLDKKQRKINHKK